MNGSVEKSKSLVEGTEENPGTPKQWNSQLYRQGTEVLGDWGTSKAPYLPIPRSISLLLLFID